MGSGMLAVRVRFGRPGIALPVDEVGGRLFGQLLPPHGVVFGVISDVGEDGALLGRRQRVGVGMLVGAGRDAEEPVFGVGCPEPSVLAHADPGDVVADRLNLIACVEIFLGRDEHGEIGLAAGGRKRRRDVLDLLVLRALAAEDEHVLRHPALFLAEIGGDAQREALLAQKHVAAVSGVDGNDRVVFGEVQDVALFGIDVALAVEALDEIAVLAQLVQAHLAHAGHDLHVQDDVDGVGHFDADAGEGGADHAHRIGNDVHRSALHFAAGDIRRHLICLFGIHPLDDGMRHRVLFPAAADKGPVLHAGDVVLRRPVQIAVGKQLFVELDHLARRHGFRPQGVPLRFAAVDPDDLVRAGERRAVLDELQHFLVVGHVGHIG